MLAAMVCGALKKHLMASVIATINSAPVDVSADAIVCAMQAIPTFWDKLVVLASPSFHE